MTEDTWSSAPTTAAPGICACINGRSTSIPTPRTILFNGAAFRKSSDLCCEVRSDFCRDIDFERLSDLCRSVVNFVKLIGEVLANAPSQPERIGRLPSGHPVARV